MGGAVIPEGGQRDPEVEDAGQVERVGVGVVVANLPPQGDDDEAEQRLLTCIQSLLGIAAMQSNKPFQVTQTLHNGTLDLGAARDQARRH